MPALYAYNAGMKSKQSKSMKQYTLRSVPPQLDERLRRKSLETGKSLNEVTLDLLKKGVGISGELVVHHDLDELIGSWKEDPEFDKALQLQKKIDEKLWS